jgi:intergrase/recombinase
VDFIQGRAATSVGAVHYLDAQRLADEWYPKIDTRIKGICTQTEKG